MYMGGQIVRDIPTGIVNNKEIVRKLGTILSIFFFVLRLFELIFVI